MPKNRCTCTNQKVKPKAITTHVTSLRRNMTVDWASKNHGVLKETSKEAENQFEYKRPKTY